MKTLRASFICLSLWLVTVAAFADDVKCDICGAVITTHFYTTVDKVIGEKKNVCEECHKIIARCFTCDLPVKNDFLKLPDGRYLCDRDSKNAVSDVNDSLETCRSVRNDLDRMLSRFLNFPDTNVIVTIGDKYQLQNLFRAPGYEDGCVTFYGATQSNPTVDGSFIHHVMVLSYLTKPRMMAVAAHEFTHTWIGQNVLRKRKLLIDKDATEGFCELVAYKYMDSIHQTGEMKNIRHNSYTKEQILAFIAADQKYGFETVLEWMKAGEDTRLDINNLDRVRAVLDDAAPVSRPVVAAGLLYVPPPVLSPVPAMLELKGISGVPQRRFALINDTTFEAGESARVRMGQTNVEVQCLEIRPDSVVVQVAGAGEKKVLRLGKK